MISPVKCRRPKLCAWATREGLLRVDPAQRLRAPKAIGRYLRFSTPTRRPGRSRPPEIGFNPMTATGNPVMPTRSRYRTGSSSNCCIRPESGRELCGLDIGDVDAQRQVLQVLRQGQQGGWSRSGTRRLTLSTGGWPGTSGVSHAGVREPIGSALPRQQRGPAQSADVARSVVYHRRGRSGGPAMESARSPAHSAATHRLEGGADLRIDAGTSRPRIARFTQMYTHVSVGRLRAVHESGTPARLTVAHDGFEPDAYRPEQAERIDVAGQMSGASPCALIRTRVVSGAGVADRLRDRLAPSDVIAAGARWAVPVRRCVMSPSGCRIDTTGRPDIARMTHDPGSRGSRGYRPGQLSRYRDGPVTNVFADREHGDHGREWVAGRTMAAASASRRYRSGTFETTDAATTATMTMTMGADGVSGSNASCADGQHRDQTQPGPIRFHRW